MEKDTLKQFNKYIAEDAIGISNKGEDEDE